MKKNVLAHSSGSYEVQERSRAPSHDAAISALSHGTTGNKRLSHGWETKDFPCPFIRNTLPLK